MKKKHVKIHRVNEESDGSIETEDLSEKDIEKDIEDQVDKIVDIKTWTRPVDEEDKI